MLRQQYQYLTALVNATQNPAAALNTPAFRLLLANAASARFGPAITPRDVMQQMAIEVGKALGFKPVPQSAKRVTDTGALNTDDDGYFAYLLQWGESNRGALQRLLLFLFNELEDSVTVWASDVCAGTCFDDINMLDRARRHVAANADVYKAYHVSDPKMPDRPENTLVVRVPRYRVDRLAVQGIDARRRKALERGFFAMERLNTAYRYILHLTAQIEEIRRVFTEHPGDVPESPLWRYLINQQQAPPA